MREKLCELLERAEGMVNNDVPSLEQIADYLIENGVVVLPCKIGSDIWWIDNTSNTVECEKRGVSGFVVKKGEILIRDRTGGEDKIGTQYCYLSKEDAEKALERMNESKVTKETLEALEKLGNRGCNNAENQTST